jgi:C1A family cysteine protease
MKLFIAAAFLAGSALARTTPADLAQANYEYSLETLMEEFNLSYTADELDTRRAILQDNLAKIQAHNEAGTSSYVMGVNRFAAMTSAEFKAYYSGYAKSARKPVEDFEAADLSAHVPVSDLPASLDWREKNVVSPVKDQAACGSCWAFSATETLESNVAINTGACVRRSGLAQGTIHETGLARSGSLLVNQCVFFFLLLVVVPSW